MVIALPSNRPPSRFYRGGARITAFRGEPPAASHEPEDWVASTTTVFGDPATGLTRLPDGRLLRDAIESDPVGWLGEEHVQRWGADAQLLVKLLDTGQRLPVHAHPHDDLAAALGHPHGKAEAWYILEGGQVHVGLQRDVTEAELADLVERQDVTALLGLLHTVEVSPGDAVWVPPGTLHAIGEGVLLLEVQQPADLSVLLEWAGFALDGARDGHLGVGFATALQAVDRSAVDAASLGELLVRGPREGSVLPPDADRYFRLDRHVVDGELTLGAGFAILTVTAGTVSVTDAQATTELGAGSTAVAAASGGVLTVHGAGELLVARPPRA